MHAMVSEHDQVVAACMITVIVLVPIVIAFSYQDRLEWQKQVPMETRTGGIDIGTTGTFPPVLMMNIYACFHFVVCSV